ncbi:putative monooxygenase [Aspergillus spinulosporus]
MAANADHRSFKVLIAGAGIAGLATAISLSRIAAIPDLEIQLYEQAPELLEIGASIALSPNGMRTLEKLGVHNALTDEVGFRGPSGIPQIFRHWKTNQVVSVDTHRNVPNPHHHTTRFHRGHLHAALLKHVPRQSIHLGKKLLYADADDNGVVLHFEDGTTARGDILIGADGLKSKVRQSFIPNYKLRFTGKVFMRSTFDASLVVGKIPHLPEDSLHWWGPEDNFFASRLGKGQYTTVGAYSDPRPSDEVEKTIAWDARGNNWHPLIKALTEATPYTNVYPNFAGDAISTWVFKDRVTLVGDAAHAHGGAFAAGGSLALDDAFALGLAFRYILARAGNPDSKGRVGVEGVKKALELYERTRKPHTHQLLEIVHAQLNSKPAAKGTEEEEDEKLINRMKRRVDTEWLSEHDVEKAFAHVVRREEEKVRALALSRSKL